MNLYKLGCCVIVLIVSVGYAIGIAVLAPSMAPIQRGTSHEFWSIATGVSLSPEADFEWGGDAYFVDATWAAYDVVHMHGSNIYSVPVSEVVTDLDAVVVRLDEAHEIGKDTPFIRGYLSWRDDKKLPRDGPALIKCIERERRRRIAERSIDGLAMSVALEEMFWQRWRRADWYWSSIVFEWLFLSDLTLFDLWPGIRGYTTFGWAMHVSLLQILFMLPAYLGYATLSLTSAGPKGGILYPFLLMFFRRGSCSSIDVLLLKYLPQILEHFRPPLAHRWH